MQRNRSNKKLQICYQIRMRENTLTKDIYNFVNIFVSFLDKVITKQSQKFINTKRRQNLSINTICKEKFHEMNK